MAPFLPAEKLREVAGRAASAALPDEVNETLPVATRGKGGVEALVLFYKIVGPPGRGKPALPSHAMRIDPRTGNVLRFWAATPRELGLGGALPSVPGAGMLPDDVTDFLDARDRFLAISPDVWAAFEAGSTSVDAATQDLVSEYYALFLRITRAPIAPFYVGGAADFFAWIRAVLGGP